MAITYDSKSVKVRINGVEVPTFNVSIDHGVPGSDRTGASVFERAGEQLIAQVHFELDAKASAEIADWLRDVERQEALKQREMELERVCVETLMRAAKIARGRPNGRLWIDLAYVRGLLLAQRKKGWAQS